MKPRVTITELVAFAHCEKKAELIQKGKTKDRKAFLDRAPVEKGVITHAIIDRRNKNGRNIP